MQRTDYLESEMLDEALEEFTVAKHNRTRQRRKRRPASKTETSRTLWIESRKGGASHNTRKRKAASDG